MLDGRPVWAPEAGPRAASPARFDRRGSFSYPQVSGPVQDVFSANGEFQFEATANGSGTRFQKPVKVV